MGQGVAEAGGSPEDPPVGIFQSATEKFLSSCRLLSVMPVNVSDASLVRQRPVGGKPLPCGVRPPPGRVQPKTPVSPRRRCGHSERPGLTRGPSVEGTARGCGGSPPTVWHRSSGAWTPGGGQCQGREPAGGGVRAGATTCTASCPRRGRRSPATVCSAGVRVARTRPARRSAWCRVGRRSVSARAPATRHRDGHHHTWTIETETAGFTQSPPTRTGRRACGARWAPRIHGPQ